MEGGDFLGIELTTDKIVSIITGFACWLIGIVLAAMVVFLIIAGIRFFLARGNEAAVADAKKNLTWTLIGILVILATNVIIATASNALGGNYSFIPLECTFKSIQSPTYITKIAPPDSTSVSGHPRASFGSAGAGAVPQSFSLSVSSSTGGATKPTEGVTLPVEDILATQTDSGWVYIANTVPDANGIMFWGSITKIMDKAALLYGITDTINKTYYGGFLQGGTIDVSSTRAYRVSYFSSSGGAPIFEVRQINSFSTTLNLIVNLPWPSSINSQRVYRVNQNFSMIGQPILESGDGVVQMGAGLDSWYISFVFSPGLWMDVQKFNLNGSGILSRGSISHRWGSFIINQSNSSLPLNTRGVWWEIFDGSNRLANFDLIFGHSRQESRSNFSFYPLRLWNSGNKIYSARYRIRQQSLGIDLIAETVIDNQENYIAGKHFYEGMTKIFDANTGQQIGTGMHEQTLSE